MRTEEVKPMMTSTIRRHTCPRCGTVLDEGPIMYRCARCKRSVYAADVNTEFRRPARTPA
jgi:DNA-directed RNA polymerase subunit RPC12/RpoP